MEYDPRIRTLDLSEPGYDISYSDTTYSPFIDCFGSSPDSVDSYVNQFVPATGQKQTSDVVTQDYKRRISRGEIINNPYQSISSLDEQGLCNLYTDVKFLRKYCSPPVSYARGWKTEGLIPSERFLMLNQTRWYAPQPAIDVDTLVNTAVSEAHARVGNSNATLLESLAELKEAEFGMVSSMRKAISLIQRLIKMKLKILADPKRLADDLADLYLFARYALRPIFIDAHGIIAQYYDVNRNKIRTTFRGHRKQTASTIDGPFHVTGSWTTGGVTFTFGFYKRAMCTRTVDVRAGVMTVTEATNLFTGLGFDLIAETAWAIVPFSFIIDWFVNISDIIGSWTPNFGIRRLASWVTVEDFSYWYSNVYGSHCQGTTSDSINEPIISDDYEVQNCWISKTVRNKWRGVDPVRAVWPSFDVQMDLTKLLDLSLILRGLSARF